MGRAPPDLSTIRSPRQREALYKTPDAWHRKSGVTLDEFISGKRNVYTEFEKRAKEAMGESAHRVFVVMPIQGETFGSQDEQRIFREYDERFEAIEECLAEFDCVAFRIDKEHPLEDLVRRIKDEIRRPAFVVATSPTNDHPAILKRDTPKR